MAVFAGIVPASPFAAAVESAADYQIALMEAFFETGGFSLLDMLLRLGAATLLGICLGADRALRGKSAGIRTHGMVALSAAAITVSAFMVHAELLAAGSENVDPLRVIQGLAQAIGFIAAGMIFVARGDVNNLTSAANIWLATAIGIASGAGQFALAIAVTVLAILLLTLARILEKALNRQADED